MEVKDKILETSLNLFYKYGIKAITMDDIAKEMGISKKTIYRFFKEKDDIVNQLSETELKKSQLMMEEMRKQANDPIHEMILISIHIQKVFAEINPVFFYDLNKQFSKALNDFKKFKSECIFTNINRNIIEGVKQGLYRSDLDVDFAAQYRVLQMDMFMGRSDFAFENISMAKAHQLIMDIFMHGISTVKGHKLINKYKNKHEEE
ncbi:MAG TPA: TetR/AcrR family transcriptional regulator [Bacteroidia bacterium]|nr:TetR/AcrR family transcriptional regulator [Bacteroidia bacterium]